MKRGKLIWIGIGFTIITIGTVSYVLNSSNEPVYQGNPASFWIQQIESEDNKANLRAFVALGPEGLPFLVRALQTQEPWSNKALKRIREKAPVWLVRKLPKPVDFEARRTGAARILGSIGLGARPAVPALIQCVEDRSPEVRESACRALGKISLDELEAARVLKGRLDDPNSMVRVGALDALGELGAVAQPAIPKIAALLNDPDTARE